MNTHTPGPWHAPADKSFYVVAGSGDEIEKYLRETSELGPAPVICNANSQANARLIAAAPTLLDALREAVEIIEGTGLDASRQRRAIAKAVG